MTHTSAATPLSAEQRYPEIPDGQMCDSCGSLRYHGAFCEKAPPVVRAGMRHHLDLLDIRLRELGVLGDSDLRRYRDELGKAVGLVCGYYDSALLAARREEEVSEVCPHGWLLARGCAVCERAPSTDERDPPESESATLARALVTLADELDRNALAVPPSAERIVAEARAALAATPEEK